MFRRLTHKLWPIEPREQALVGGLALLHFFVLFGFTIAKASRDGLYLGELPAQTLPFVFFGLAASTGVVSFAYERLTGRLSSDKTLAAGLVATSLSLVAFAALYHPGSAAVPVVHYIWTGTYGLILVSQFWTLVGDRINPRQAKRVISVVGAGGIVGGIAGGLTASAISHAIRTQDLLLVAAALFLAGAWITRRVGANEPVPVESQAGTQVGFRDALQSRYVRLLVVLFLIAGVTSAVVDYQFKLIVQQKWTGPEAIASVFGGFYVAQSVLALVVQMGLTGFLLARIGVRGVSVFLPAGLLAFGIGSAIVPVFALVLGARLWDAALRASAVRSSWEFLYFPLSERMRTVARQLVDAVVTRTAEAWAGVLILVLNALMVGTVSQLAVIVSALAVVWGVLERFASRSYVNELSQSLNRMTAGGDTHSETLTEVALVGELLGMLESPFENRVLYAMNILSSTQRDALDPQLPRLLQHTSSRVKARALALLGEGEGDVDAEEIRALLEDDDDEVRMNAAYFYCRVVPGEPADTMGELLRSPNAAIRSGALQCVASHGGADDDENINALAVGFLESGDVADRHAVAVAAGLRPSPSLLHKHLRTLFSDPELNTRKAAIRSAGRTGVRSFVPPLIEGLGDRAVRDDARAALAQFGTRVIGTLGDFLADPTVDDAIRVEIPGVLGLIGGAESVAMLARAIPTNDAVLSYRVLRTLNQMRREDAALLQPGKAIGSQIDRVAADYAADILYRESLSGMGNDRAVRLLRRALSEDATRALERVFLGLNLVYPQREMEDAYRGIVSASKRVRAQSIEYLETIFSPEHKRLLLPLIEDPVTSRILRVFPDQRPKAADGVGSLRALAESGDAWLRSCALVAIGSLGLSELVDVVSRAMNTVDPTARQAARWAAARIGRA